MPVVQEVQQLVLLGAGSVATSLALALEATPTVARIVQIYSPGGSSARLLAARLGRPVAVASCLEDVLPDASGYLLAVPDDALPAVTDALAGRVGGYLLHCSGATPLSVLSAKHPRSGVLYPLSTFSRGRIVPMRDVPLYLETGCDDLVPPLEQLAYSLSDQVYWASSEQRLALHLAAVVACNFSNHLIATAEELLLRYALPPKALLPLLDEMVAKLHRLPAQEAQTGPARRGDEVTMQRHRELLADDQELSGLYDLLSARIRRY